MSDFIGHYPVSDLPDRYGYKNTKTYGLLGDLKIERVKKGTKAYVSDSDLESLDRYVAALKTKGPVEAEKVKAEILGDAGGALVPSGVPESADSDQAIAIAGALAGQLAAAFSVGTGTVEQPADPLAPQKALDDAACESYQLTTAQVRKIVGMKSWKGQARYGFKFECLGTQGKTKLWRVERD